MQKQTMCMGRSPGGALLSGGRHTWRALPTFASTVALAGGTRACSSQTSAARHTGDTLAPGTRTGFSTHEEVGQHPKANAAGGPASKHNTKHNTSGKQHETKHLADGEKLPNASKTNGTISKNEHSVATLAKKRNLQGEREHVAVAVGTLAQTSCAQRQPTSANMSICDTRSAFCFLFLHKRRLVPAPLSTRSQPVPKCTPVPRCTPVWKCTPGSAQRRLRRPPAAATRICASPFAAAAADGTAAPGLPRERPATHPAPFTRRPSPPSRWPAPSGQLLPPGRVPL